MNPQDPQDPQTDPRELLAFLLRLGHALLATGDTVAFVEDTLRRIAAAHGVADAHVVAFPTALFIKLGQGADAHVDFTSAEGLRLRFDQSAAVFEVIEAAGRRSLPPREGIARLQAVLAKPPLFNVGLEIGGHVLVTVGLALVLQPRAGVVAAAAFFGLIVGALKVLARDRGVFSTLLPSIAAFVVAAIALVAVEQGLPASPLVVLVASLVTFLPGGTLAIAIMELAYGDVVSGGTRFVTGLTQLLFLVLGMLAATSIVGLPAAQLLGASPTAPLGAWAPWLGVALFALGHALHFSVPLAQLPWLAATLFTAQLVQTTAGAAFGGYMGGFFGALAITPLAYFMQRRLGGPPAIVTFPPALWLLVPGSLGLIGLAELAADARLAGLENFVITLFTITAIALGSMLGLALYNAADPVFGSAQSLARRMAGGRSRPD